jgi:hypothetical protein
MTPHNKKFDEKTELEICKKYLDGKTTTALASEYGFKGRKSISDILKRHNIPRRNRQEEQRKNTTYANFSFEIIDSKEKAYFLGLLMTDGYIINNEKIHSYIVGISLTDIDAIKLISEITNAPIYTVPIRDKMTMNAYRVNLYGKRYVEQLNRFGIHTRKTYDLSNINLTDEEKSFLPYIIRGIIDGDGWIRNDGKEFFISSASESFVKYLTKEMIDLGFDVSYKFCKNDYNGYFLIRSAKKNNIKLLKELIYDVPFGMQAKYNKLHNL